MSNKMDNLIEKMIENLHEVTVDQLKPGRMVSVYTVGKDRLKTEWPSASTLEQWRDLAARRYFLAEKPTPEYEPGTLARITDFQGASRNVVRSYGDEWIGSLGFTYPDRDDSTVEVIAYPDGTRPGLEVTDEDVERANSLLWGSPLDPKRPRGIRAALEDFAARKSGGQA